MDHIKVVIVDDHALFRSGIRRLLCLSDGIEVVGEAGSGEEAIALIAATTPNVVLMDIDMPGVGGVPATEAIRSMYPDCHVILLTGHRRYVLAGIQAGASGYLLKDA